MYRVLLVDDEKAIVGGLKMLIDWEEAGFSIAGEAYDGDEGVEAARAMLPDVVITDIRMPLVSGHELIDRVKEFQPACKFLLVSGFSNFEYARDAMDRGVSGYLLKPIQKTELLEKLALIKGELDWQINRELEMERIRLTLSESLPIVRERYLRDVLSGGMEAWELREKWDYLELGYAFTKACVMVVERDRGAEGGGPGTSSLHRMVLEEAIKGIVDGLRAGITLPSSHSRLAVICCESGGVPLSQEAVSRAAYRIGGSVERLLGETVSIGIGKAVHRLEDLHSSYQQAEEALQYKLLYGDGSVIFAEDILKESCAVPFPLELEKSLLSHVALGQEAQALEGLDTIFHHLRENGGNFEAYYTLCLHLVFMTNQCLFASGCNDDFQGTSRFALLEALSLKTLEELKAYTQERIQKAAAAICAARQEKSKGTLEKVMRYVREHYQEEISLDFLSRKFFINASYLSQLFKKEANCSYIDFLTDIRLKEARRLLELPELKVYEVCERVGYNSQRYFSQLFRKYYGMTPSAFREQQGQP